MNTREMLQKAQNAFRSRQGLKALHLLEAILAHGDSPDDAASHLLRGLIYEFGCEDVAVDLARAIGSYRAASNLIGNSDPIPFLYLARSLMKQGKDNYSGAFKAIQNACAARWTPECHLALGYFYEQSDDLDAARRHYGKAALNGRFAGFFGLSTVLRKSGKTTQAVLVDVCRILMGPLIFLVLGKRATSSFNGY